MLTRVHAAPTRSPSIRTPGPLTRAWVLPAACAAMGASGSAAIASPYASTVDSYDAGADASASFTDPAAALGAPTRITSPGSPFGGATTPFQSAFGVGELVSIGQGGHLTVSFTNAVRNDALNPFGLDLIVFANTFYIDQDFPNGVAGPKFGTGGTIWLSNDGVNFVEVVGANTADAFPTLGYLDPSGPLTLTDPITGTIPSDFTRPVDPTFDPSGLALDAIIAGYAGSGGGLGIDIGALGFDFITHVRIENASGSGVRATIDGFADVAAVPAPAGVLAGVVVLGGASARRRRGHGAS